LDGVGAPPERASIPTPQTDIPLALLHTQGLGEVLFLPFQLSMLVSKFKLLEHYQLVKNAIDTLRSEESIFDMTPINGIQASLFQNENGLLLHFINGIGQRPLAATTPYHDLTFSLLCPDTATIRSCIAEERIKTEVRNGRLYCTLKKLECWDMLEILY